jgi:hypothetical protein
VSGSSLRAGGGPDFFGAGRVFGDFLFALIGEYLRIVALQPTPSVPERRPAVRAGAGRRQRQHRWRPVPRPGQTGRP